MTTIAGALVLACGRPPATRAEHAPAESHLVDAGASRAVPPRGGSAPAALRGTAAGAADAPGTSECRATSGYGEFRPTEPEVIAMVQSLAKGLCYGYFQVDAEGLSAAAAECAKRSGSTTFVTTLSFPNGTCELRIRAASFRGRRFLQSQETYATEVLSSSGERTFGVGRKVRLFELRGGQQVPYAAGQPCADDEIDRLSPELATLSKTIREDWAVLPADLKRFMCALD